MLRGRESLVRLIGKRRRLLPSSRRRHLLSATPANGSLSACGGAKDKGCAKPPMKPRKKLGLEEYEMKGGERTDEEEEVAEEAKKSVLVNCPVCGTRVSSEDNTFNSHLDMCLTRGSKRKFTQFTLLQFNFTKDNVYHNDEIVASRDVVHTDCDYVLQQDIPCQVAEFTASKDVNTNTDALFTTCETTLDRIKQSNGECEGKLAINSGFVTHGHEDGFREESVAETDINVKAKNASVFSKMASNMKRIMSEVSEAVLETYIVGHRFVDEVEIKSGASIFLLRDPDNPKDPNAIKIVDADTECHRVMGFLPRALAQYLSTLMDKYQMLFEGIITSIPKHSLDVVPIALTCQKTPSEGNIGNDDFQHFKALWENVLCSIDDGKRHPPRLAKYQQNFSLIIQEVLKSNPNLYAEDEICFLELFNSLSEDGQRLFIRLYMRKGPWFRLSNISYPEMLDSQQVVMGLLETGYLCSFDSQHEMDDTDLKEVLNVLTVTELHEIQSMFEKKCQVIMRKQALVTSLLSLYKNGVCPLPSLVMQKTGMCVRISSVAESLLWRAQRLFFLNGDQDLSAFLLIDLGIVKYPKYNCLISDEVFSDRSNLLAYEEAFEVAQIMDEALDEQNHATVLKCIEISEANLSSQKGTQFSTSEWVATFLRCFTASWVYSKVVLLGASFLEHQRRYTEAIRLLKLLLMHFTCDGRRGYWTLRLSVDLEHIGHIDESLSVAENGLQDSCVRAGSRVALQRRVIRLGKPPRRWKIPSFSQSVKRKISEICIQGRPLNCKAGTRNRFYGEYGEQCGVEQLALQYYAGEGGGWQGVHTESGIWLTIFGLLMWDIIFADVPNVFRSKFQNAPLDLETDAFYIARETLIESHLKSIHDGMGETILIMSWGCHLGTACRGVNWDRHSLSELRAAVSCIGGPCLASMCRLLCQDYRSWSSGMPDLLLWQFHGDYRGEAKLVEVKGPRDRLSEQQRAWLLALMDYGFNVEVCKVCPSPPLST